MLSIVTGLPGASKSYMCAQKTVELVARNRKWFKRTGRVRPVVSNLVLSDEFFNKANGYVEFEDKTTGEVYHNEEDFLQYWEDPEQLPHLKNCDVIWEEMGAHVDSRSWEQLPLDLRRWLQQHRHRGVNIVGNCQDFADIDIAVRRLTGELLYLTKLAGSRDPSPTTLPPKWIWGIILKMYLDPRNYEEQKKLSQGSFGGLEFVSREGVELYSMHNDIKPGKYPPLQHRSRTCADCGFVKTVHI